MFWIKNTSGKRDAVLTMAWLGFVTVLLKVIVAGATLHLTDTRSIVFGTIDGSVIGAILTPTLGAYVARRYTDAKHGTPVPPPPAPTTETES